MKSSTLAAAAALATLVAALPAAAQDSGNYIVRLRATNLRSANTNHTTVPGLTINDKTIPELDLSMFFTPNIAAELILTVPQKHTVYSNGTALGTFKHLPPTLLAQYHFTGLGAFRPYVGAGINYTNISSVNLGGANLSRSSWGLAAQVGVDIPVGGGWLLNADVKKVQIGTTVSAGGADVGKFKVDPLLVSLGVGMRF